MPEMSTPDVLVNAVTKLTDAVKSLDTLLRDEYPKRSEVERTFVTKLENQKIVTKVILVALISVLGCYVMTIGAYSQCLVGEESPGFCVYVPGYEERVERRDYIDDQLAGYERELNKLREEVKGQR